jgi:hypothetical protein
MTDEEVARAGEDVRQLEGIRTTRAIRRLRPDPVPRALLRKVCGPAPSRPRAATASPGSSWR